MTIDVSTLLLLEVVYHTKSKYFVPTIMGALLKWLKCRLLTYLHKDERTGKISDAPNIFQWYKSENKVAMLHRLLVVIS